MSLTQTAIGVLLYTLLLSLALLGVAAALAVLLWRAPARGRVLAPHGRLISLGLGLMVAGPTILWSIQRSLFQTLAPTAGEGAPVILGGPALVALLGLSWGGVALFVAGWSLAGAGLRPRGRPRLGLLGALGVYAACGLGWLLAFVDSGVSLSKIGSILNPVNLPIVLAQILLWPSLLAQRLGVFG